MMSLLLMIFVIRALIGGSGELAAGRVTPTVLLAAAESPAPAPRVVNESPPAAAASVPEPRSDPLPPARPASRSGATLTTAEIVARCEPSVALIKGNVSSGTGFVISAGSSQPMRT